MQAHLAVQGYPECKLFNIAEVECPAANGIAGNLGVTPFLEGNSNLDVAHGDAAPPLPAMRPGPLRFIASGPWTTRSLQKS